MSANNKIMVDHAKPGQLGWEDSYTMRHMIERLGQCGCEDKEIASLLGVRLGSLKKQLTAVPELEECLVRGRSRATQHMVAALYKTAIGGNVYQEVYEKIDANGKKRTTIATKEAPPNPTLMMFWLVNRDPENWQHVRQLLKESRQVKPDGNAAEADKITRLSRDILECYPADASGQHFVSKETPREPQQEPVVSGDLSADMCREAADSVQDDVLDVSAQTRTESL